MVEQSTDFELDPSAEPKSGLSKKLIIMIAAGSLVLLAGGAAATYFLVADDGRASVAGDGGSDARTDEGADQEVSRKPAVYHPLSPAFVVSLEGRPKMLQVSMQVMTRDAELVEFLQHNDPLIRDSMLSLLMEQNGAKLKTRAGKKTLQSKLEKQIRKIVKKEGAKGKVEALYFTSFVMQ